MADIVLTAKTPLDGYDVTIGRCRMREITDFEMVSVAVPLAEEPSVKGALKAAFGLTFPDHGQSIVSGANRAIRMGPDQLMLLLGDRSSLDAMTALEGAAYVTEQTGNWVICEISGDGARAALERLCPVDLHDAVFPEGACARTVMEHMNAAIVRTGPQTWWLMSASSSAKSFAHAIEQSMHYTS